MLDFDAVETFIADLQHAPKAFGVRRVSTA
jgi:hypothetical protein